MNERSADASKVVITELMIPSYANFGGKIHGGILLSLMDKAAYAAATRHSGAYCVTVSVDNVDFKQPVEVGDLVSLKAMVNYVGRSSMVIGIRVEAENVKTGIIKHTNTSYFTMVAKNDKGNPTAVPSLLLNTNNQVRRFCEAKKRKVKKTTDKKEEIKIKNSFNLETEICNLNNENCRIEIIR